MDRSDSGKMNGSSNGSSSRRNKRSSRSVTDDDAAIAPLSPPSRDTRGVYDTLSRSQQSRGSSDSMNVDETTERTAQDISSPKKRPEHPRTSSSRSSGSNGETTPRGQRVSLSARTQLDELEQKKLSEVKSSSRIEVPRTPVHRGSSSSLNERNIKSALSSPRTPIVSPKIRAQLDELELKKLDDSSSGRRTEVVRPPVRMGASSKSDRRESKRLSGSSLVSPSTRTQLDELEQKKLDESSSSRTEVLRSPVRMGSSSKGESKRLSGSFLVSPSTRTQLDELEQKKLDDSSSSRTEIARPSGVRRGSSASEKGVTRVSAIARGQLEDLEQKKLAANASNATESSQVRRSRPGSVSDLEREKKIAAGSPVTSQPRKLSVSELEREKKIAAAGMNPNAVATARLSGQYSKSGKVLTDQNGRSIDLDDEFARLHAGGSLAGQRRASDEIDDSGRSALPGAVAVYEFEYEGHEDHEPDYVNPDNFDAERAQAEAEADAGVGKAEEQSPFAQLQEAQARSIHNVGSQEDQQGQNRLFFPSVKRNGVCFPLVLLAIVIVGVAVGVTFAVRGGKGGDSPTIAVLPGTLTPTASPTTLAPTPLPTFGPPSLSPRPSSSPSNAPSAIPWVMQGKVEGASFGSSVDMVTDFLVFSNSTHILSYELVDGAWSPIGQALPGDLVRLAETQRILVRDDAELKVYDLDGGVWSRVGEDGDIELPGLPDSISISGDGLTIAMSAIVSSVVYRCRVYRHDDVSGWSQVGRDISTNANTSLTGTTLSYDGNLLCVGDDRNPEWPQTQVYSPPVSNVLGHEWLPLTKNHKVFGDGPSNAISRYDPEVIVSGGAGFITAFDKSANKLAESLDEVAAIPSLAITDDGTTLAYAWNMNLRVKKLVNGSWVDEGSLPEFDFSIDSISFSSDGRLAVGQPEAGIVEIFALPN